jgi:hypothetical protein
MIRFFIATIIFFALLTVTRLGAAAEIVTECPQLMDDGRKLVARKLLPDALPMKRVGQKSRELPPPFSGAELDWLFWYKGLAPITDAAFSCLYEDKGELYVPIRGMLISCRILMPSAPSRSDGWPILCTSETDPSVLLNR